MQWELRVIMHNVTNGKHRDTYAIASTKLTTKLAKHNVS